MRDLSSILVKKTTRAKLKKLGKKGETYDDVINHLMDARKNG